MLQTLTRRAALSIDSLSFYRQCANVARKTVCLEDVAAPVPPLPPPLEQGKQTAGVEQQAAAQQAKEAQQKPVGLMERPDPHAIECDYIGPPDELSNLRPIVRCIPKNETPLASRLRRKQEEVEKWNHEFWSKHNKRFYEEKQEFINLHKAAGIDEISADKMSVFYKAFLDKNRKMHILYNLSWYLKNVDLLMLAFQVFIQKLYLKRKNRK